MAFMLGGLGLAAWFLLPSGRGPLAAVFAYCTVVALFKAWRGSKL